jgi:transitional endoplasmic reticulum ATPase
MSALPPEAELHYIRGLVHLRRGEGILPYALKRREDQVPAGADVFLALVGFAAVATSRALRQTGWIDAYRKEMRAALTEFDAGLVRAPQFADLHFRRAQALRYLGENARAREAAQTASTLAPGNADYGGLNRVLDRPSEPPSAAIRVAPHPQMAGVPPRNTARRVAAASRAPLTWDDVILPARTKRELRQVQLVLESPEQARRLGIEPPSGLLLYGPPGTGKTTVARVLAAQSNCRFFATTPAEVSSMWIGEGEKAVARLFADARASAPSILFLDEIDALIPSRSGGVQQHSDKLVNQFLLEMDGLIASVGVFVIGATNRPDMLDAALLRGGRLSRRIAIPLPDTDARRKILALHSDGALLADDIDLDALAAATKGFSGADLRALVTEAGMQALIRLADHGGPEEVTADDFALAFDNLNDRDAI